MKKKLFVLFACCVARFVMAQPKPEHNLLFDKTPTRWENALPLGNGMLGCLIWQKENNLRFALDRADLWDTRPMKGLARPEFSYQWVAEQVKKDNYDLVQEYFDRPYEQEAGPTKLPAAAVEWQITDVEMQRAELDISTGLASIYLSKKLVIRTFVHASREEGWFRIEGAPAHFQDASNPLFSLIAPAYSGPGDLSRLGYRQGAIVEGKHLRAYTQPYYGGASYEVAIAWRASADGAVEGVWSVSAQSGAKKSVRKALRRGFEKSFAESKKWWAGFWAKSSVSLPDPVIERQYYLDLYKFGCAARAGAPMINLQSVWTADNGRLPPWKSDFHHDLNTQLSYWPAYTANHLDLAIGYLNHLEKNGSIHRAYTRRFFGTPGLNVPGVESLNGEPLGGWIQYACSPTTSAWLAQHFYLQWRYSQDRTFLKKHAWPFLRDAATHLEALSFFDENGKRILPLSSSPEVNDNHASAWFPNSWTNHDLALARFLFEKTAELASDLGHDKEAEKWLKALSQLPSFYMEQNGALKIAPQLTHHESHRHFSHLLSIHPLRLLDWGKEDERRVIKQSLTQLHDTGTGAWTGYSFSWFANLLACARDGNGARDALRIFAEAFVSQNSFHLNGDQTGKGYSNNASDPFTLEGNFAFAAGVLEMLLQSPNGAIRVFPALPDDWQEVSFNNLLAEGAILVSATLKEGRLSKIHLKALKDTHPFLLPMPDDNGAHFTLKNTKLGGYEPHSAAWKVEMKAGGELIYEAK